MSSSATLRRLGLWLTGGIALLVLPLLGDPATVSLLNQIGVAIVFALAYNLLLGQSGLLSFGHAVYFGVGGFFSIQTMAWVNEKAVWVPTPFIPLVGALAGAVFGMILGYFCTRRHGVAFAMITLAVTELMNAGALMLNEVSGGEEGISAGREPFLGIAFGTENEVYYLVLFWVLLSTGVLYGFTRTPFGRLALAVRDNAERAQFAGYNIYAVRLIVFTISGLFSGLAGALLAINTEIINYEIMGLLESGSVLINTYIGGIGFFSGPILGAALLTTLQLTLSNYTEAWQFYQGIIFILVVLYAPEGLAGIVYIHRPLLRRGLLRPVLSAYGVAAVPATLLALAVILLVEFIFHWSVQFYSAEPVELFGIAWRPGGPAPWLTMALPFTLGLLGLRLAARRARARWDEAGQALKDAEG